VDGQASLLPPLTPARYNTPMPQTTNDDAVPSFLLENIRTATETFAALTALEEPLNQAAAVLGDCLTSGHKLLACGNGGSAADAAHMTTEFVCRFTRDRQPYPAICLNSNGGDLTAIANDYCYEEVFSRQVRAFAVPGDVVLVLTTSGNSENIRRTLEAAKAKEGVTSIALLGKGGGGCQGLADIELIVPGTQITARIQEAHQLLIHTLCEMVEGRLEA
jgi:phosphoheptose isomerase